MKKIIKIKRAVSRTCFFITLLCYLGISVISCFPHSPDLFLTCLIIGTASALIMNISGGIETEAFNRKCDKGCRIVLKLCFVAAVILYVIYLFTELEIICRIANICLFWLILSATLVWLEKQRLKHKNSKHEKVF